jgi:tRNA-splicing ligase RtcB
VLIHTGSRGYGYQICDDSLEYMQDAVSEYDIRLPDRQLACAPLDSTQGQQYLAAMACAANFAWANRQMIQHRIRQAFERILGRSAERLGMEQVYDVSHNIAKLETHEVDGEARKLCIHRKGATRAFGPGHPSVPECYRSIGQPVLVPGDMGTFSYVLVGTDQAMAETWGSTCHGAGRLLSRHAALRHKQAHEVVRELEARGILVTAASKKSIAEEQPDAYKDVSEVVDVVHGAGISRKVARLRPLAVAKG